MTTQEQFEQLMKTYPPPEGFTVVRRPNGGLEIVIARRAYITDYVIFEGCDLAVIRLAIQRALGSFGKVWPCPRSETAPVEVDRMEGLWAVMRFDRRFWPDHGDTPTVVGSFPTMLVSYRKALEVGRYVMVGVVAVPDATRVVGLVGESIKEIGLC